MLNHTLAGKNGYWGLTETTVLDQLAILTLLVEENDILHQHQREYLLTLMQRVLNGQDFGYDALRKNGASLFIKNGWSPKAENNWRMNTLSLIKMDGYTYGLCVMSVGNETYEKGVENMEKMIETIWPNQNKNA
jgi:hypothetical protein